MRAALRGERFDPYCAINPLLRGDDPEGFGLDGDWEDVTGAGDTGNGVTGKGVVGVDTSLGESAGIDSSSNGMGEPMYCLYV